jgi:hypothetical protein
VSSSCVIVDTSYRDRPKEHELSAAYIISNYFHSTVCFVRPSTQRTPDFIINDMAWELKSPLGNGKNTIKNCLHSARKQSVNVIIDLRRIKMPERKALANIRYFFSSHRSSIEHLLIISKNNEVIDFL